MPEIAEIHLISPLRLMRDDSLVDAARFHPGDLPRALIRRVSMLMTFHTRADLEVDFRALTARAAGARMAEPSLALASQKRWSATQRENLKMDGLIGGFLGMARS